MSKGEQTNWLFVFVDCFVCLNVSISVDIDIRAGTINSIDKHILNWFHESVNRKANKQVIHLLLELIAIRFPFPYSNCTKRRENIQNFERFLPKRRGKSRKINFLCTSSSERKVAPQQANGFWAGHLPARTGAGEKVRKLGDAKLLNERSKEYKSNKIDQTLKNKKIWKRTPLPPADPWYCQIDFAASSSSSSWFIFPFNIILFHWQTQGENPGGGITWKMVEWTAVIGTQKRTVPSGWKKVGRARVCQGFPGFFKSYQDLEV